MEAGRWRLGVRMSHSGFGEVVSGGSKGGEWKGERWRGGRGRVNEG